MSMHIAILAFVASFVAITSWLVNREPADHSAGDAEFVGQPQKNNPPDRENSEQSEPTHDDVIALSDTEIALKEKLNRLIVPLVDFDDVSVEEALDFLRLSVREPDPDFTNSLSYIIRKPRAARNGEDIHDSGDGLDAEPSLEPSIGSIKISLHGRNMTVAQVLDGICNEAQLRWGITDDAVTVSLLH